MKNIIFGVGVLSAVHIIVIIVFTYHGRVVETAYRRNSEIFNIGWIWSMPYDIGNTLRAPLAGPLSLILTACLSIIMFFGMAASPVYYLLGTPPRKYHVNDAIQTIPFPVRRGLRSLNETQEVYYETLSSQDYNDSGRSYSYNFEQPIKQSQSQDHWDDDMETSSSSWDFNSNNQNENEDQGSQEYSNSNHPPNFIDSAFFFLPESDVNCRKLLLCHSHGFLTFLPTYCLQVYRVFSKKMLSIPTEYQAAIQAGLEDQGSCAIRYGNCTRDVVAIASHTFLSMFVGDDILNYNYFPETGGTESIFQFI